jgi:tetratricopeptide (TPR) repeat protein
LKLGAAKVLLIREKKIHPKNSIVPLLENYIDYFTILTTDNKNDFDKLKDNKSIRLDLISDDDEENSPYYLYAQAEINLQWALIRGRYGEYFTAAREINKANSMLLENQNKFPGFHLNLKGLGVINAFLGNLPDGMLKSTLATLGIKGNLVAGTTMLDKLAENLPKSVYKPFFEEVIFYDALVLSDVAKSPDAYAKIIKYTSKISDTSLLKTYIQAYSSLRTGHNERAIKILADRPIGKEYQVFPYLDLLMGTALLNKVDYSGGTWFLKFLSANRGTGYIKDAYLHLGWIDLLKGDTAGYKVNMAKVGEKGYTYQEKDKQALSESQNSIPNVVLLKARLLFDGGYFTQSMSLLKNLDPMPLASLKNKAEYFYRLGRINQELGNEDTAIKNYANAYHIGKNLKDYFAANSALQIGKIYEEKKNKLNARIYYNMVLKMKDHDYKSSIDLQAKAALKRLGS